VFELFKGIVDEFYRVLRIVKCLKTVFLPLSEQTSDDICACKDQLIAELTAKAAVNKKAGKSSTDSGVFIISPF